MKTTWEVADIFRLYGKAYQKTNPLSYKELKTMHHITACRTAQLGGHIEQCNNCDFERISYNSCRDRHCPKCQSMVKEKWLNDRKADLLPCNYFHMVFILPHKLNPIILKNKKVMLNILFLAVSQTLQSFAKDPQWRLKGQTGFICVLHTWSQKLIDHFHLHCLIAGGALSFDKKQWVSSKGTFMFRVQSLAKEFKKRYLHLFEKAYLNNELFFPGKTAKYESREEFDSLVQSLFKNKWITYAKRPFAGPEQVLEYLGRYTHRVAISNNRIKLIDNDQVSFEYKDRTDNDMIKMMTVSANEFIRRFLLHVLPYNFMKIRYFGFLSHRNKKQAIKLIRKFINPNAVLPKKIKETVFEMMLRLTGQDITCCPKCKKGKMTITKELTNQYLNSS
ncbi:MAG: IS91 family transposase [Desulfobacteraceae bacterium]|nr:IS91 family transposase [Desulfobacteraceae bacterium]